MASVFVGEHTLLGHKVAIKVLQKRHLDNPAIERRFFNEAKVIASIRHPNIVEIFDFGRADSGGAYIVMELLDGQTLRSRIRRGIMPERQSVLFMRQLASALAEAHAMGVIHRDLKPDNVFIIADEEVELGERIKLLDFGIAKRIDPAALLAPASEQTATGILVGTPAYMSPEQCKGLGNIDGRSDIYSLGVVLYRMLTNQLPFEASGTGELIGKHLYVEPLDVREINPDISVDLAAVVKRCLEKDPDARYPAMGDLVNAFGDLISPESTRHLRAPARPTDGGRGHPTPSGTSGTSGERVAPSYGSIPPPVTEISATTLRTATGEQLSPAYATAANPRGRNWILWTAVGCVGAMVIGVVALSGGGEGSGDGMNAAERAAGLAPALERSGAAAAAAPAPAAAAVDESRPTGEAAAAAPIETKAGGVAATDEAGEESEHRPSAAEVVEPSAIGQGQAASASVRRAAEEAAAKRAAADREADRLADQKREAARRAADKRAADKRAADKQAAAEAAAAQKARAEKKKKKKEKTFDDVKTPMLY